MASIVTDQQVYDFLDILSADDVGQVALAIRDAVEELLTTRTGQVFGAEATVANEQHDGSGNNIIYTYRPIKVLTAISIRYLNDELLDTYNVDITDGITFTVGKRRLYSRILPFPCGTDNILISYTAAANQPAIAVQAVKQAVAAIYRGRGSEDARSEQMGTFSHVMLRSLDELKFWADAVALLTIPFIG